MKQYSRVARGFFAALSAVAVAAIGLPAAHAAVGPAASDYTEPTWLAQVGQPGHAGLYAWGMATESDGNIVVGDYENKVVRILTPSGATVATLGVAGGGQGLIGEPYGLAVDPSDGTLYVADVVSDRIDIYNGPTLGYSYRGSYSVSTLHGGFLPPPRLYVARMAVDAAGDLWVDNAQGAPGYPFPNATYKLIKDGHGGLAYSGLSFTTTDTYYSPNPATIRALTFGQGPCLSDPSAYCQDLFMVEPGNDWIEVVDPFVAAANPTVPDAGLIEKIGFPGSATTLGALGNDIRDVTVDSTHHLVYVTDPSHEHVVVYSTTGTPLYQWGTSGSAPSSFGGVRDLTIGLNGDLYIGDYTDFRVDMWTPYATGGPPPSFVTNLPDPAEPPPNGGLNQPQDVAVSPITGDVFVADLNNNRVQQFANLASEDPTCHCLPFVATWGQRSNATTYGMDYPRGVAVDPVTGQLWLNNTRQGNIKIYSANGTSTPPLVTSFGTQGVDTPPWAYPNWYFYSRGVHVSNDGTVAYIVDTLNDRIKRVQADGPTAQIGTVQAMVACGTSVLYTGPSFNFMGGCIGVTQGPNGDVYATDPLNNTIDIFDANLNPLATVTTPVGDVAGQLNEPYSMAYDPARNLLYVTEYKGNRVDVYDATNPTSPRWVGSFGSAGTGNSQFDEPAGISLDAAGNIYVMDSLNQRVQVFAPAG